MLAKGTVRMSPCYRYQDDGYVLSSQGMQVKYRNDHTSVEKRPCL